MADTTHPLWYQLGYALERARREPTGDRIRDLGRKLAAFRREDQGPTAPSRNGEEKTEDQAADWLVATVSGGVVAAALRGWRPRAQPGVALVARATAAGAAAAVVLELGRELLRGERDWDVETLTDRLLSGAARGLVFGAVAEPRLPGPPLLRGAAWGTAEFLLTPLGGLGRLLGRHTPYGRIPAVQTVLGGTESGDDGFVEHLVFGIALALLAGTAGRGDPV